MYISNDKIIKMFKEIDCSFNIGKIGRNEVELKQNEIVKKMSFIVYGQTRQYRMYENYNDLVQEGLFGLVKAVRKFDYTKFPNFFVYAKQWVKHYIKCAASKFDIVKCPSKIRVIYAEPNEEEEDIAPTPDEALFALEQKECIIGILNNFKYRDRNIVFELFGLHGGGIKALRDVGTQFGLTHEGVRKIKNSVLDRLSKNKKMVELNHG